jgi:hypothetical protein
MEEGEESLYVNKILTFMYVQTRSCTAKNNGPIKVFIPSRVRTLIRLTTGDPGHMLPDQEVEGTEIPLDIKRCTCKVCIELYP